MKRRKEKAQRHIKSIHLLSSWTHIANVPGSGDTKLTIQSLCPSGAYILTRDITKHRCVTHQAVVSFKEKKNQGTGIMGDGS